MKIDGCSPETFILFFYWATCWTLSALSTHSILCWVSTEAVRSIRKQPNYARPKRVHDSPSMCAVSMPFIEIFCRDGCMLNRLATKARLSLLFPEVTSWGETNCLQSSRAACCSISSALWFKSGSFTHTGNRHTCAVILLYVHSFC